MRSILRLSLLLSLPGIYCPAQQLSLAARDAFNMGVLEFQAGQFKSAAQSFSKAADLAPTLLKARVYLAAAWVQAYVPADESPANVEVGKAGVAACEEVLKRDPRNVVATDSLATLYFQMKDFVRAREWNLRVVALAPDSKSSLYMLGAIAWSDVSLRLREARLNLGMTPEEPGPLPDEELRGKLRTQALKELNEGIGFERAALVLDPKFARAMLAMNDLLRARADLGTPEEYAADIKEATGWMEKGLALAAAEK